MKKIYSLFFILVLSNVLHANNIVVQNVTTTGNNATNKTIQVQFDLSWENSWRDAINWDAAWIFMKYKDANGLWQHVQLNTTGFTNGTGTANTVQVTSDKVGAWVQRSAVGTGAFNCTAMQLQWNYGLSGLTSVTGIEVRVYAIEMVYIPEGEFNVAKAFNNSTTGNCGGNLVYRNFNAPGNNHPVINTRLSSILSYNDGTNTATIRIKGDAGIDTDNNGSIDNTTYPTGYMAFYCYKYELTEQQYADFLNTLTSSQITSLGIAGVNITLTNGQYFSSTPNRACSNSTATRLLAYADWSGVRPMTLLEFNKVSYGPLQPVYYDNAPGSCAKGIAGYPAWGNPSAGGCNFAAMGAPLADVGSFATTSSTRIQAGASYYGILDLTGNAHEPVVKMNYFTFQNTNGNGTLASNGNADISNWSNSNMLTYIDMTCSAGTSGTYGNVFMIFKYGFRYVRSAE
jgi:hypothetical protein